MPEDILKEIIRLAVSGGVGLPVVLGVIVVAAVLLVVGRKFGAMKLPTPAPPSPDLVEVPPSPPIIVRPDGSIPVSNPVVPPEVIP